VDYYDSGDGSVFEVAAEANKVNYTNKCCSKVSAGTRPSVPSGLVAALGVFVVAVLALL
jgi:hypothetical protein